MITETISQRFNASIIIREKLPQIIEAFVNFYGEEERDYIEDKFKKVFIVSYGSPKSYERIIDKNDKKVKDYLEEKLLADLKIPRNLKHRFLESIFGEHEIFDNETPIEEYIKYLNGNISEISYLRISKLLNYFGKNYNINIIKRHIKKGGYEELDEVIKVYQKAKEEYHKYLESTKVYRDYIVRCQDLYSKLETKYLKKYINEIKDVFSKDELQELEDFLSKKLPYDELSPRIKNYIGTNPLNSPPLVETFDRESEIIIQKDDSWQKRSIIQDRITYFKNLGINLGENYQRYQMNKEAKVAGGTTYELTTFLVSNFYQRYKNSIITSRKNGNIDIIYDKVGKENFEALNALIIRFKSKFNRTKYEHTKAYIEMGFETEDTKELKRIIEIRDNILENMKKYQTRMTK